MKEFKLRKWYPSLPENWKNKHIVIIESAHGFRLHPAINNGDLTDETVRWTEVVESEFWEEVVPIKKEYEVITYTAGKNKFIKDVLSWNKNRFYRVGYPDDGSYDNLKEGGDYATEKLKIYSVKRLSDGEVFTVGDKLDETSFIQGAKSHPISKDNIITRIGIVKDVSNDVVSPYAKNKYKDKLFFCASNSYDNLNVSLDNAKKAEKPLMLTKDGVEVFDGERVYQVSTIDRMYIIHTTTVRKEITPPPSYFKYFSTKEAAENYIMLNKPVLSLNDIAQVLHLDFKSLSEYPFTEKLYSKVKKVVKDKLK